MGSIRSINVFLGRLYQWVSVQLPIIKIGEKDSSTVYTMHGGHINFSVRILCQFQDVPDRLLFHRVHLLRLRNQHLHLHWRDISPEVSHNFNQHVDNGVGWHSTLSAYPQSDSHLEVCLHVLRGYTHHHDPILIQVFPGKSSFSGIQELLHAGKTNIREDLHC